MWQKSIIFADDFITILYVALIAGTIIIFVKIIRVSLRWYEQKTTDTQDGYSSFYKYGRISSV